MNIIYKSPVDLEKKLIRKHSNIINLSYVIANIIISLIMEIIMVVLHILKYDITNDYITWIFQIISTSIIFTFPFIIASVMLNYSINSLISFSVPNKRKAVGFFLIGMGCFSFIDIINSGYMDILNIFGIKEKEVSLLNPSFTQGKGIPFIALIAGSILPGLLEEFACRGVILNSLKRFGEGFAIIISALFFGLMHGTISQMPFAFFAGLVLGFIYIKTKSIWVTVAIHTCNNFIAFLFDVIKPHFSSFDFVILNYLFYIILMVGGMVGLHLLKDKKSLFKLKKDNNILPESKRVITYILTPGFIIFIIMILAEMMILYLL